MRTDHPIATRRAALALYGKGRSAAEVGRHLGVPGSTVTTWAKLAGISRSHSKAHVIRHGKRTVAAMARLSAMADLTHADAARRLGVNPKTVARWRAKLAPV